MFSKRLALVGYFFFMTLVKGVYYSLLKPTFDCQGLTQTYIDVCLSIALIFM